LSADDEKILAGAGSKVVGFFTSHDGSCLSDQMPSIIILISGSHLSVLAIDAKAPQSMRS